jgi:hypothetical protein
MRHEYLVKNLEVIRPHGPRSNALSLTPARGSRSNMMKARQRETQHLPRFRALVVRYKPYVLPWSGIDLAPRGVWCTRW